MQEKPIRVEVEQTVRIEPREAAIVCDSLLQMLLEVAHRFDQRAAAIRTERSVDSVQLSPSYQLSKVVEALAKDIRDAVDVTMRGVVRHLHGSNT
jgi:hypothetical protein